MSQDTDSPIRLCSYEDDMPQEGKGSLIPLPRARRARAGRAVTFSPQSTRKQSSKKAHAVLAVVAVVAFLLVGSMGYGLVSRAQLASVPTVTIVDPLTSSATALPFGPHTAFNQVNFFTDTREALIAERLNFIEIDVPQRQLRFFKRGILYQSTEMFRVGETGSWWHVPSGFYQVERKKEREFTTVGQAYLPWVITFQKNFVIHGWPTYPDGTPVPSEYSGGGVRISDTAAQSLFGNVTEGTPVLVHNTPQVKRDVFVYEPQVPDLKTPHYFIADIKNDTILAATDLNDPAPIASIVKLMTAVVAAEELNLDSRVRVTAPTFVTSLVPRLADRNSVSMYSLLQLLLVESSNEASETIAGEMGREAFIEAMNAKARQLGMLNTQFADPSGLSSENISTIGDLYRLTKYIYENRSFILEITANEKLPSAYVGGEFGGLINFNEIEDMDSFAGGKVGETRAAGQTSVSLHRVTLRGEERVLTIILLGSHGRTADVETLLHYVQSRFDR